MDVQFSLADVATNPTFTLEVSGVSDSLTGFSMAGQGARVRDLRHTPCPNRATPTDTFNRHQLPPVNRYQPTPSYS